MTPTSNGKATIIRTERGLTIAGTRTMESSDRVVWRVAQENQMILLTANPR